MRDAQPPLGPVSETLVRALHDEVARGGPVIWLDRDSHYTAFADAFGSRAPAPFRILAWRGSYLSLMLALDGSADDTARPRLVIHMPGFNEESIKQTPLLELYAAGRRFRKKLETLIEEAAAGRVPPDKIAAFLASTAWTLASADAWLAAELADRSSGLAAILRAMQPTAVLDDLLTGGPLSQRLSPDHMDDLWSQLTSWTGLPTNWQALMLPSGCKRSGDYAFVYASWALCVEFADDLTRETRSPHLEGIRTLPKAVIKTCRTIAAHLRLQHAAFYKRTADETEALLSEEIKDAKAEDLGEIDTFRFEEDLVLKAALDALHAQRWAQARDWAAARLDGDTRGASFWASEDPSRQSAWRLIEGGASLGAALTHAGSPTATPTATSGFEDVLRHYEEKGAAVDYAHRHLEQRRVALLYPQLPEFEALRASLDELRTLWRLWADQWAVDFNALCRREGFLPAAARQQRHLFDDVVRPLTQEQGTTAFFMVDALRFEMGQELFAAFKDMPATKATLDVRLAELPTVTEVGMNALAPVAVQGKLTPALTPQGALAGFSAGEFRVFDPETRRRAIHDRVGGAACPWMSLDEVTARDSASLKRSIARAKLIVVHSREIDEAGERGNGPAVFDLVMQKLRAAWRLLRDAGVRRFVITADHGFLLLHDDNNAPQAHGRKVDPKRRYVLSNVAADHRGEVRVALGALDYVGGDGFLMFPETTTVFDTGKRPSGFVHGGNSLQERVIPVLTLVHKGGAGGSDLQYTVKATRLEGVGGMHCVEVRLDVSQQSLSFGGVKEVELGLRVLDVPDAHVELCQTRGPARLASGAIQAPIGERFEVFFRLSGRLDGRALVEVYPATGGLDVTPCVIEARFEVSAHLVGGTPQEARRPSDPPTASANSGRAWLDQLEDGGTRQVFAHISAHGAITEAEATAMLGGPRQFRMFALQVDKLSERAPFSVKVDTTTGMKRYVRDGSDA
jgi:hypothetical protein